MKWWMEQIKPTWESIWVSIVLEGGAGICSILFFLDSPGPGIAVAALGTFAAVISIRNPSQFERFVCMIIVFLLLYDEVQSIRVDRTSQLRAEEELQQLQNKQFQAVVTGLQASLTESHDQFKATVQDLNGVLIATKGVALTAQDNLNAVSGKDSYPCIVPQSHAVAEDKIPLVLHNRGKNNLTGVEVQILSPHAFTEDIREFYKPTIDLGTVNPIWPKPIPGGIAPEIQEDGTAGYTCFIWTQNGFFSEVINFRRGKNSLPWAYQYWLTKREVFAKATKQFPKGAQVSMPMKGCYETSWSDDLGDGKPAH